MSRQKAITAKLSLLLALLAPVGPLLGAQSEVRATDVLYMRAGEEYVGRLEGVGDGKVVFVDERRGRMTLDAKDVQRVELGKARQGDRWRKVSDIDDPILLQTLKSAPGAKAHPDSGYVTLYQETSVSLNRDGSARTTERTIQKVFKERGKRVANKALYYLTDNSTADIDFGRTVTPDGKVISLADSAIQDGSVFTQFPEYQNLNRKQAALKEVKPGSVIDYQTTIVERKTDLTHPFLVHELFAGREPILKKIVRVTVPKECNGAYQAIRFPDVAAEVRDLPGGMQRYTWSVSNRPQLVRENNMPETEDLWPRLAFAPVAAWEDLSKAYALKLRPLLRAGKSLVDGSKAIVKEQASDEAKARAIYTYQVKEIRTIPVPYYAHTLVPSDVNTVYERKYGNDLEKTLLAVAMLRAAGLAAAPCLVRPQSSGALMRNVSSLGQFTQCLVRARLGGKDWYFRVLDEKLPMDVLSSDCRDVWGLLIDEEHPALVRTPLPPAEADGTRRSFDVTVQTDGTFDVSETIQHDGLAAVGVRGLKVMKEAERERHFQQEVSRAHTNAELLSYRLSDLNDLSVPVEVVLRYRFKDYAVRAGEKLMIFRLPSFSHSSYAVGKATRTHPLNWTTRWRTTDHYTLRLPKGLKVSHVPQRVTFDTPIVSYKAQFRLDGTRVIFEDEFRRRAIAAPASEYASYKAFVEARAKLSKEWIVVER